MQICLVGGIYGKNEKQRKALQITPEITLEHGLRVLGHSVSTFGHYDKINHSDFDIVHVHHLSFGAASAACSKADASFAFTLHDPKVMQGELSLVRSLSLRFILRRADAIVALSKMEKTFLEKTFRMEKRPEVIANGIDSSVYSYVPKVGRPHNRQWLILYVGQLVEMKRVDCLLNALSLLPRNIELKLAYHNAKLETRLRAQAQQLNLVERVHFLGAQTPSQLAELYHSADLFVLPSSGEALPSVVAEAMLCGTPVVATTVGGIPEQLGPYGITVPPGNVHALHTAIHQVLNSYKMFADRGLEMSKFAQSRCSIQAMVEGHVKMYERMLESPRPVRHNSATHVPIHAIAGELVDFICKRKRTHPRLTRVSSAH